VGPTNHDNRGQGRTNPFVATRGDKTAMWPSSKFFDYMLIVMIIVVCSFRAVT